jgi:hypothetical protein
MHDDVRVEPRTAKATRAAQLAAQRKRARYLTDRGWICIAPDETNYDALLQLWFSNTKPEDAIDALRLALVGEKES